MGTDNTNTDDNSANLDLGFNVSGVNTDLFKMFHEGKAQDATKDVMLNTDKKDDDPDASKNNSGAPDGGKGGDKGADADKIEFKTDTVLELAKKAALGQNSNDGDDDNDDENKNKNKDDKGANGPVATLPENEQFQVLYDHLVAAMNYRPLTAEELGEEGMTEEKFLEFQEKNLTEKATAEAEEMISEAFEKHPQNAPIAKELLRFLANGGNIGDFIDLNKDIEIGNEYLTEAANDDDKEVRAEKVMRTYYKSIGWADETVEKTVKTLKTGGMLVGLAETTLPEFVKVRDNKKAIAVQTNEQNRTVSESRIKEYNTKLLATIDSATEIGQFKLTPETKKGLKEYMYTPTVDIGNGQKVPQYFADLENAKRNPNFAIYQALNLKNKSIDLSAVQQEAANKEKASLKDKLTDLAKGKKIEQPASSSASQSDSRKKITDLLDFENIQFVN